MTHLNHWQHDSEELLPEHEKIEGLHVVVLGWVYLLKQHQALTSFCKHLQNINEPIPFHIDLLYLYIDFIDICVFSELSVKDCT